MLRVDIVFDRYVPNSLKAQTRAAHGTGDTMRVTLTSTISSRFVSFLAVGENKKQLFHIIGEYLSSRNYEDGKAVVCTYEDTSLHKRV